MSLSGSTRKIIVPIKATVMKIIENKERTSINVPFAKKRSKLYRILSRCFRIKIPLEESISHYLFTSICKEKDEKCSL